MFISPMPIWQKGFYMKLEAFWEKIAEWPWMLPVILSAQKGDNFFTDYDGSPFDITKNPRKFGRAFVFGNQTLWGPIHYIAPRPNGTPLDASYEMSSRQQETRRPPEGSEVTARDAIYITNTQITYDYFIICFSRDRSGEAEMWIRLKPQGGERVADALFEMPTKLRKHVVVRATNIKRTCHARFPDTRIVQTLPPVNSWGYELWIDKDYK